MTGNSSSSTGPGAAASTTGRATGWTGRCSPGPDITSTRATHTVATDFSIADGVATFVGEQSGLTWRVAWQPGPSLPCSRHRWYGAAVSGGGITYDRGRGRGGVGGGRALGRALDRLPDELAAAVQDIARLHGKDAEWLNANPSELLKVGLPQGWTARLARRHLIATKRYALTDQSPTSKHADDRVALDPSHGELEAAAAWCREHDPSSNFADQLQQAVSWLRSRLS